MQHMVLSLSTRVRGGLSVHSVQVSLVLFMSRIAENDGICEYFRFSQRRSLCIREKQVPRDIKCVCL